MEKSTLARKGAWTGEEDQLLRMCIENYGEGKWHKIPERAGLNRCRKSCRMRWLNYLKPNIKRGDFSVDEVDMIVRLHKLLGNRWSLISGRLPGRTSNDVKNYWNTHLRKKKATSGKEQEVSETLVTTTPKLVTRSNIFKPRPRAFSKRFFSCGVSNKYEFGNPRAATSWEPFIDDQTVPNINSQKKLTTAETMSPQDNSLSRWWEDLLVLAKSDEECKVGGLFCEEVAPEDDININEGEVSGPKNLWEHWTGFSFDADIWSLLEERTAVQDPIYYPAPFYLDQL